MSYICQVPPYVPTLNIPKISSEIEDDPLDMTFVHSFEKLNLKNYADKFDGQPLNNTAPYVDIANIDESLDEKFIF